MKLSLWIKQIFKGVFDSLATVLKNPVNIIIGLINGLVEGVAEGINAVISSLNKINIKVPDRVSKYGGKSFGFDLKKVSAPKIPYLASGAVIPPNDPFMAMSGDQRNGTNLESPERLIRKIVQEDSGRNQRNGGTTVLKLHLDGKQIAETVVKQGKLEQMASGRNMFALG